MTDTALSSYVLNPARSLTDILFHLKWFLRLGSSHAVTPDADPDNGYHPEEVQALKDYYHRGQTSAQEAAYAITRPVVTSASVDVGFERRMLMNLLIDALEKWPQSESWPLFALLKEIEKLPEPVIREEARHSVTMSEPFWRALPGFMNEWADIFQWGEWRYGIENRPEDLDLRRRMREKYMHIASLEARLVDESVGSIELRLGI